MKLLAVLMILLLFLASSPCLRFVLEMHEFTVRPQANF